MASFRAYFIFKERIPEKVTFRIKEKTPIILKIEKGDFQPLKLTHKN